MKDIITVSHNLLTKKQKTIAVAESCTGGGLSCLLTHLPGSSGYFILGVVPYSNKMKQAILRIPAYLLIQKGAVSKPVAEKMASAVKRIAKADFGIGITGIAGPQGGNQTKPKGTVFIAVAGENKKICKEFHFKGNRSSVRKQSALGALKLLKKIL
jgi:PncC family amidohydrolase